MQLALSVLLVLGMTLSTSGALAAGEPSVQELPPGAFYRFRDENGRLVMTSILPRKAIELGYEIVDGQGRVVAVVEKAPPEEERRRRLKEKQQQERDKDLLRMYPTPEDAMRARDRQIQAVQLNISYATNSLEQLRSKLDQEVAAAAGHERAGRAVPESLQAVIDQYRRQIREKEELVEKHQADIEALEQEYSPIIERLQYLVTKGQT